MYSMLTYWSISSVSHAVHQTAVQEHFQDTEAEPGSRLSFRCLLFLFAVEDSPSPSILRVFGVCRERRDEIYGLQAQVVMGDQGEAEYLPRGRTLSALSHFQFLHSTHTLLGVLPALHRSQSIMDTSPILEYTADENADVQPSYDEAIPVGESSTLEHRISSEIAPAALAARISINKVYVMPESSMNRVGKVRLPNFFYGRNR